MSNLIGHSLERVGSLYSIDFRVVENILEVLGPFCKHSKYCGVFGRKVIVHNFLFVEWPNTDRYLLANLKLVGCLHLFYLFLLIIFGNQIEGGLWRIREDWFAHVFWNLLCNLLHNFPFIFLFLCFLLINIDFRTLFAGIKKIKTLILSLRLQSG
jgi:hypothetical protein